MTENKGLIKSNAVKLFIAIIILFIIVNLVPTKYYVMSPGIAQELSPIITVKGGHKGVTSGDFMLTAVASHRATLFDIIYISLKKPRGIEIESVEEQLPPGMDMDGYLEIMANLMEESKLHAQAVAFKKLGYRVKVEGKGAEIVEVLPEGSAGNVLKKGDIIVGIDGKEVSFATDAVKLIRKHNIGEEVKLKVLRGKEVMHFRVKTVELKNSPGKASIGVLITTRDLSYYFPKKVIFNTKNIVGPSAGAMFTLEIYNQLIPEDITKGRRIAGTGTISLDGHIGKIDGVTQKVMAAERAGADLFLSPAKNYSEAKKAARRIKVVKVNNIDEAIRYLKNN
ncbi:YlbL family protein [Halothermothrix orenii]|uniref:endopeptidase La n=1 Tax=Halothermothrix orenii (strain H 168 / OCM 544 / DSM 9562) TaxID=373903 RepID=B8CWV5_HALOH|nr:PDZ domain-containing protein [Halothermothrix orenii]ACL69774.1 PDZ/DHR/GLGF domain protein [Halothermothrix orenii H 168]